MLRIPKNIVKFETSTLKSKFKIKNTKLTAINCPAIPIHLKLIYVDFLKEWYFEVSKNLIVRYQDFAHLLR